MPTIDDRAAIAPETSLLDLGGYPWLENGERMDRATFLDRYEKTAPGFRAELIEGIVYVMSPLRNRHGRPDNRFSGLLFTIVALLQ